MRSAVSQGLRQPRRSLKVSRYNGKRRHKEDIARTDGPASGYETIIMDVTLDPGAIVARHTHPGIDSTYVMEGEIELPFKADRRRR